MGQDNVERLVTETENLNRLNPRLHGKATVERLLKIIRIEHEALWKIWDEKEEMNCGCDSRAKKAIDETNNLAGEVTEEEIK